MRMRAHTVLVGLVIGSCVPVGDLNRQSDRVFDEVRLDETTPMLTFELRVCSTEPHITVEVGFWPESKLPRGALVGITMVQGEHIVTGFARRSETNDISEAEAIMFEVACDEPIDVTIERLDGALAGDVSGAVFVFADAEGTEGTTEIEVVQ